MDDKEISKKDKIIFILGVLITLLFSGISGYLYYQTQFANKKEEILVKSTDVPSATSKPQENIDLKTTKIEVLNASKKTGLAKAYADKLKNGGYLDVTTGNFKDETNDNLLLAPVDDAGLMNSIGITEYKYKKSENIKIIVID